MAPLSLPITNGSVSPSANATSERAFLPSPVPCQPVDQSKWGPDSISNIVFGLVMVFISLFAIYQTRRERRPRGSKRVEENRVRGEEEGVGAGDDEVAVSAGASEERFGGGKEIIGYVGEDEEEGEGDLRRVDDGFTRTNTEVTLVDGDEESREVTLTASKLASVDGE